VLVVYSNIEPGNSGSPVLVRGDVTGVVFSKSLSQSETAYAVRRDRGARRCRDAGARNAVDAELLELARRTHRGT